MQKPSLCPKAFAPPGAAMREDASLSVMLLEYAGNLVALWLFNNAYHLDHMGVQRWFWG